MQYQARPESNDPRDVAAFVELRLSQRQNEMMAHIDKRFNELMERFEDGYPDGDLAMHRAWHEEQIELMRAGRKLRESVVEKVASGGAWAASSPATARRAALKSLMTSAPTATRAATTCCCRAA